MNTIEQLRGDVRTLGHLTESDDIEKVAKLLLRIVNTISDLEDRIDALEPEQVEPEYFLGSTIEKYTSNSGNTTWKLRNGADEIVYLRQSHKGLLEEASIWDALNALPFGKMAQCNITAQVIQDGDFLKPVAFPQASVLYSPEPTLLITPINDAKDDAPDFLRAILDDGDFIVLDTETTGIFNASACQIAIIDGDGNALFDRLINPDKDIERGAMTLHGISNEMVADAPRMFEVQDEIETILKNTNRIVGYNIGYDIDVLTRDGIHVPDVQIIDIMEIFSQIYGDWNERHKSYTWQKLTKAAQHYGISTEGAHGALADARMTLAVMKKIANS